MSSRQQVQQGSGSGGGGWPDVAPNFTYGAKTWVVGRPASASPMHSGGIPDSYSLGAGSLPGGVTLDTVGGLISGRPNADGSGSQVVNGSNAYGANTGDGTLTWTVELAPVFTYPDPPAWPLDVAIMPISPTVSAGTVNTYGDLNSVLGALGLSLDTDTGEITGTPTSLFSGDVTIRGYGLQGATYDYDIPVVIEAPQTGMLFWIDAQQETTFSDNDPVGAPGNWEGSAHGFSASGDARPTYRSMGLNNKAAYEFDGVDDHWLSSTLASVAGDRTFYIVTDKDPADAFFFDSFMGRLALGGTGGQVGFYDAGNSWKYVGASQSGPQLLTFVLKSGGTQAKVYRNGTLLGTAKVYTQTAIGGNTTICRQVDVAQNYLTGMLGEVRSYFGAHDDTTRAGIESTLMTKWALTAAKTYTVEFSGPDGSTETDVEIQVQGVV